MTHHQTTSTHATLWRTLGVLGLMAGAATTGGCVKHIYAINMNNPIVTGVVESNRIEARQRSLEHYHQLPAHTLSNTASITELNDKRICFDLELRAIAPNDNYIDPNNWDMGIFGKPDFSNDNGSREGLGQRRETDMQGMIGVKTTRVERTCTKDAKGKEVCKDREVVTTVKQPGTVKVIAQPYKACFANAGYVTPNTKFLSLRLRRKGTLASNIFFQWDFR